MSLKQLFATKSLEMLDAEAKGENRLRRVLGPIGLTSLGVGAIIGAGIFVMTGRVASVDAGPAVILSYLLAGFACALAAFCYSEFASMAPVAGSAYTYAYATLGELFAWIIGWDLILEYAMSAATVAAAWTSYFNKFLKIVFQVELPKQICTDPFTTGGETWFNLPAMVILVIITIVLVIGIRESAASNTVMVLIKLSVVIFVIALGLPMVDPANWTTIPVEARLQPEQGIIPTVIGEKIKTEKAKESAEVKDELTKRWTKQSLAVFLIENAEKSGNAELLKRMREKHSPNLPTTDAERENARAIIKSAQDPKARAAQNREKLGMIVELGLLEKLQAVDDNTRSSFMPYGISGVIIGAALVFFAFIGFDSISTHSEEAINPQRDLPIGIISSLVLCSVLYVGVSAVITGMVPYPDIDHGAAIASAFGDEGIRTNSTLLKLSAALIAIGGLAGMTSVLLITFLSQARIFLAMARDGLLPHSVFGVVHPKFRTPHVSTMLTGGIIALVAGFTPILRLEEMVNIGTLFAFVVVCAAVLILRIKRPEAHRPFRCPLVYIVAPMGIAVNVLLMLFLPLHTWERLAYWLLLGLVFYFSFGFWNSTMANRLSKVVGSPETGIASGAPPRA